MNSLYPWNEKAEKYLRRLAKDRILYTNDIEFTRTLGRRYPNLLKADDGFLDIGRIERRHSSMIAIRPGSGIAPKRENRKFLQFDFFKI